MSRVRRTIGAHLDLLVALAVATLYLVEILVESAFAGDRLPSAAAALGFASTFVVRRRAPIVPLLAGLGVIVLSNVALRALAEAGTFTFAFVFALYSAGRHATGRSLAACVALGLAAIPNAAIEPGSPFTLADLGFFVMFFGGPLVAGRVVRGRVERTRAAEGRAVEAEVQRDVAIGEERERIARELHDVVAHAISVIVLQARGGRRMLDEDPAQTRSALDAIEHAGAQALTEMRRLLGMLRERDEELGLAPQPSLARLDELAEAVRATGLPLDVVVEGVPFELPPGIDVSAYRIVQEALTNALKHAGPARARVVVRYAPDALELDIVDDGSGNGRPSGAGHGLVGIRERVAVYGGALETGRRPEGGYALRARLPLDSTR